jgi:predicted dehydrogenase
MSAKLRMGLIGCGRAAERYYLPALGAVQDIEVVAAVDPVEERRSLVSDRFKGCVPYAAADDELIDRLDAGIIVSPPDTHAALAAAFLKRNRCVLVEKPLAPSMDGIADLKGAADASKGFLTMGFNFRFWEPVIRLRDILTREAGPDSLEVVFTGDYSLWDPVSFVSDSLEDLGPHVFDLVRFILKREMRSLSAVSRGKSGVDLEISVAENVRVHCRIAHYGGMNRIIRIPGRFSLNHRSVRVRPEPGWTRSLLDLSDRIRTKLSGQTFPIKKTFEIQLGKFFDAVRSGRPSGPGLEDGISAIRAVEAARVSLRQNGREIPIHETA